MADLKNKPVIIGKCPICDRNMIKGPSINKHHFIPKCRGGKETKFLHKVCHNKIHSLWDEKECEKNYSDPNVVCAHPEIIKFIDFIKDKDPEFYDRNDNHKKKKRR